MLSGGIPFIDILIFAAIAIFLGLRLHSVLGKRTGFEQENVRDEKQIKAFEEGKATETTEISGVKVSGVDAVKAADSSFDEEYFINGASSAYAMILEAFANDDIEALKPLLGYEMAASFSEAIHTRQKEGEQLSIDLVKLEKVEIVDASLIEGLVAITVDFVSKQKRLIRAEDGTLLDGDEKKTEKFHDRWIFERDISSSDPNWLLVETETLKS